MNKPIIPWPGGKRRFIRHLLPLVGEPRCYVEVFGGGAALLFAKPPSPAEVLNDINGELVNLYRVVRHHLDELVRMFRWALVSRKMFEWAQVTNPETLTDIQRAARFYYLQRLSFGAKVSSQTFGYSATGPARLNLLRVEEDLSAAHLRLARVTVECLPWADIIRRYDRPDTVFYLDPPYWQTEGYGVDFGWPEYEGLVAAMRGMKGRAILSINDHPDIRRLVAGLPATAVPITYTIGGGNASKKASELVVTSWRR